MAEDFSRAVDDGLKLSKRLYFGKDRAVAPPKPPAMVDMSGQSYLPAAPMVYAVIYDPSIVDNPDIPSYQPHVHGRCDPPALIPLQMNGVELEADCYLDTAFVRVTGSWRVHCVMGSRSCDCRIAIPMGEQGSILGLEVGILRKSYHTQVIAIDDHIDGEKPARVEEGGFLTPHVFTLTIPQVDGGSILSVQIRWSQKLSYCNGQLSLNVPFTFPDYVTPAGKNISKKEKIQLNVNAGHGAEILCKTTSHPLKELRRHVGKLSFSYESEVLSWSRTDFSFSYTVSSTDVTGGVILQSPSVHDVDQRDLFCIYLYPGNQPNRKVFRKKIVYTVDISGSLRGKPLDDIKNALFAALSNLDPEDSFNIIAFNSETYLFSTSMEMATKEAVERATQWISINFIAGGGTNISLPLTKAIEMLSTAGSSIPIIFLITDGSVEDERQICDLVKNNLKVGRSIHPRIYTCGIGSFCNQYFLRMLAVIGRGRYVAACDIDTVGVAVNKLFAAASTVLANITFDAFDDLGDAEVYPSPIPDLSCEGLLTITGRYRGTFPDSIKAKCLLPNLSDFVVDLKVQQAKDIPLDQLIAREQIQQLTAEAWLSEDKQLQEKVANLSVQTGVVSEYTQMSILETDGKGAKEVSNKSNKKAKNVRHLGIGFGNLTATADNIPPGSEEPKLPEAAELFMKAASSCCGSIFGHCCCPCCIQACSNMNNQCAIALTQLCMALACFGCVECCADMCCSSSDL